MELFTELNSWLGKHQQSKTIGSYQTVLVAAHGGDLNGFILVNGEPEKLDKLTSSDEWLDFMVRGGVNAMGWGSTKAFVGDEIPSVMKRYAKYI